MKYFLIVIFSLLIVLFLKKEVKYENNQLKENYTFSIDWYKSYRKWLDIAWWVKLIYNVDLSKYKENNIKKEALEIIKKNIENRISKLWVADYSVRSLYVDEKYYIEVQIWWIHDLEYAKNIIWKTTQLEFMLPFDWEVNEELKNKRYKIAEDIMFKILSWISIDKILYFPYDELTNNWISYITINESKEKLPEFLTWEYNTWFINKIFYWEYNKKRGWFILYYKWYENDKYNFEWIFVNEKPYWQLAKDKKTWKYLDWSYFKFAQASFSQNWEPVVLINFDDVWKEIFCNITRDNVNKENWIFIGWKLITAPVIREPICWWTAQISWNFDTKEAKNLAKDLNEGALPAELILVSEEKISPLLWENVIKWALIAWFIWLILVSIYIYIVYWFKYLIITLISLISYILVILAITKLIDYAFSLAWIAAIILSIWMAVDANILIYERLKEELNLWKNIIRAIQDAYQRAWFAIRDWNLTTWLVAIVLFSLWMNIFKWFWFMFIITILTTLFFLVPFIKILTLLILSWKK